MDSCNNLKSTSRSLRSLVTERDLASDLD